MKYLFSPSVNAFYPNEMKSYYEAAGSLPADLIEVDSEVFDEFSSIPEGKVRVVDNDGMPVWGDVPPPTKEELIAQAESKKAYLRIQADSEIDWRQDAIDAGIATEEETTALSEWKKYRVLLMRVDTADPEWPTPPRS
ncbi:tail fiber assembly protein [Salmonella enterica]|nr:tail fiber assembly protein [Salmonella enterica]EHN7880967.1 tail fiber assembly protein [Salmonella enterica]